MIEIIAVSTHDARKVVADLVRLLEAEEHRVRVISGRHSAAEIDAAKTSRDAILMVWSKDAPASSYMLEWLRQSDPTRLVEVAISPGWPERKDRKAPVIDFSTWRGERGGRAWNALADRLKAVSNIVDPPKPPALGAALGLGAASFAAVFVAIGVRNAADHPVSTPTLEPQQAVATLEAPTVSVGGALYTLEPPSVDDIALVPDVRPLRIPLVDVTAEPDLIELNTAPLPEVRDPTLIERLRGLNLPLPRANDSDEPSGGQ